MKIGGNVCGEYGDAAVRRIFVQICVVGGNDLRLKFKQIDETRDLKENFTVKDLLNELELSSQTIVAKRNGELTIEDSVIEDGDEIQLVQIIYGG